MATPNLAAVATSVPTNLYTGQITTLTNSALYTVPASTSAIVRHGTITNISGSQLCTLSSNLSTSGAITSLPVNALTQAIPSGTSLYITASGNTQTFVSSANAASGATSITITSITPNFAYPSATALTAQVAQSVNVSLGIVPTGATANTTQWLIAAYALGAGDTLSLQPYLEGACLGAGDAIYAMVTVSGVIDVSITGMVNT